ncbi:MAG: hypothetical protein B7Y39_19780 [Bdellovibrio sp. 28-41-41]|nr:MAG: hypothetical protein B7Y39_19780 [Bdellovibrio sp. 28-41-41]
MAKKIGKKVTTVHEHAMHVPVSEKNPSGTTLRDQHTRRLKGTYLDLTEMENIFKTYDKKNIIYPTQKKLAHRDSDKYDEVIAIWCDYFNKKFNTNPPLEPNVVKALIASESEFKVDPPRNPKATGIAQITAETLKALQDPKGEVKDFLFKDIRKKDLKNPNTAIPMAIRWLSRKKRLAEGKLGRAATAEEIILEYKGLLKSSSRFKEKAIEKFRKEYGHLTKK